MIRPYNVPGWVYFILGIGLSASLFFSTYSFLMIMSLPHFEGLGIIESGDVSLSYYSSTMMSGCSNKTVGVMSKTFTGTTIIAYGCPTSRNFCSEYVCTGERICEEVLSPGSGCSEDHDCTEDGTRCDTASCTCVPDGTRCTSDSQCLDLNATSVCVESFCDVSEGQCKTRYINETMDSCDNDNNCGDDLICRGCMCIAMPEMNVTSCTMDSDCINYEETSSCIEAFCNMTTLSCATRFQDMSFDCDGSCPLGEVCTDCICTPIPSSECTTASDCLNTTATSECIHVDCIMGQCQTQFIENATCDGSCPPGEVCTDCICTPIPSSGCTTASDCLNTTATSECVDVDCIMGQCRTQFIGGATCDGSCPSGQSCQDCQCVSLSSDSGFQLIQSGVATFTGPLTSNVNYELYASGNVRMLTWENIGGGASSSTTFFSSNGLIASQDRPLVGTRTAVVVSANNQAGFGTFIVNTLGNIIIFSGAGSGSFGAGNSAQVLAGFIQWSVTLPD